MNNGICVCVFLAVLSSGCVGRLADGSDYGSPIASEVEENLTMQQKQTRETQSLDHLKPFQMGRFNKEEKPNLGGLLTRYLQQVRKGSLAKNALAGNKLQKVDNSHRLSDRDYMGWMDFGRRSAEEYEYLS
uniref:Cholecystokinin n=1 Tax=Callorhinchus milii TaxID=7868 RepID=A0A4W3HS59_CALMI|eukprot:gi/632958510/ref/XP_007895078.1/ PREDICTED: cholecystokinin [Callorhinchus milii]